MLVHRLQNSLVDFHGILTAQLFYPRFLQVFLIVNDHLSAYVLIALGSFELFALNSIDGEFIQSLYRGILLEDFTVDKCIVSFLKDTLLHTDA